MGGGSSCLGSVSDVEVKPGANTDAAARRCQEKPRQPETWLRDAGKRAGAGAQEAGLDCRLRPDAGLRRRGWSVGSALVGGA